MFNTPCCSLLAHKPRSVFSFYQLSAGNLKKNRRNKSDVIYHGSLTMGCHQLYTGLLISQMSAQMRYLFIDQHIKFSYRSKYILPQKQYWYYLRFPRSNILLAINLAERNRAFGEWRQQYVTSRPHWTHRLKDIFFPISNFVYQLSAMK